MKLATFNERWRGSNSGRIVTVKRDFIAYKRVRGTIVELVIPEGARVFHMAGKGKMHTDVALVTGVFPFSNRGNGMDKMVIPEAYTKVTDISKRYFNLRRMERFTYVLGDTATPYKDFSEAETNCVSGYTSLPQGSRALYGANMRVMTEKEISDKARDEFRWSDMLMTAYVKGAQEAQKLLLESASEGFDQDRFDKWSKENLYSIHEGCYGKQVRSNALALWQACSLSHAKKMQEKDAEIENLISCLSEILTFKGPEYQKIIQGKPFSIFSLVRECLQEERSNSFHAGYAGRKEEIEKLQKENQEMHEALNQAVKILEEGCLVYDQHVPSGSSSFRVEADIFIKDVSKCYSLSETPNSSKEGV